LIGVMGIWIDPQHEGPILPEGGRRKSARGLDTGLEAASVVQIG